MLGFRICMSLEHGVPCKGRKHKRNPTIYYTHKHTPVLGLLGFLCLIASTKQIYIWGIDQQLATGT